MIVIHVLLKTELLHIHFLQFLAFLCVKKTICCSFWYLAFKNTKKIAPSIPRLGGPFPWSRLCWMGTYRSAPLLSSWAVFLLWSSCWWGSSKYTPSLCWGRIVGVGVLLAALAVFAVLFFLLFFRLWQFLRLGGGGGHCDVFGYGTVGYCFRRLGWCRCLVWHWWAGVPGLGLG